MSSVAIQELQYRISLYQKNIDELQREISELSRKKEALLNLESAHSRRVSVFYDLHHRQRARLNETSSTQTIQYAEGHKRNLESHIAANPHSWTDSSLSEATLMVKNGIRRCSEDILDKQQQIQNFQAEIRYLQERIRHIQQLMV